MTAGPLGFSDLSHGRRKREAGTMALHRDACRRLQASGQR